MTSDGWPLRPVPQQLVLTRIARAEQTARLLRIQADIILLTHSAPVLSEVVRDLLRHAGSTLAEVVLDRE